ncbi:uncharacterized protein LOC128991426 [Macrosteles quadrilineatus]|uniref:uncharacterized protein LOC128991426 n=1 Tax=Macrosteles quadrilineatus TaxID=74068 RepID=UPI0023E199B3|nr:uncharacterized protein LOC128991426 [Macrosteles quadrilineatus]
MLRPILLIFCSFVVCDAFVKSIINDAEMEKRIKKLKSELSPLSTTSLEDHGELTCISETWSKWSSGGWQPQNYQAFLAKLTNKRDGQQFLLDWYYVDDCSDDTKATRSIQQVKEVGGDKVEVKYKVTSKDAIVDQSQVYMFNVNQNAYDRV